MALTTLSSSSLSPGTSLVDWDSSVKTANFTATSNSGYWVDTSSAEITVTLPSSPSVGDMIVIGDYASNFNTNGCVVALNGNKLNGDTINGKLSTQGQTTALVYTNITKGWLVSSSGLTSEISQPSFISATGGTITTSGNFKYHAFTTSGTFTVTSLGNPAGGGSTIEYLVVGGGGSGGTGQSGVGAQNNGGGGGAGGIVNNTSFTVSVQAYTITIGAGGAGVNPPNNAGNDGNNTTAFGATGGYGHNNNGMAGGLSGSPQSRGGGAASQYAGGGGGGAGGGGANSTGNSIAPGGVGLQYSNFSQFGAEAQASGSITANPTANGFFGGGGEGAGNAGGPARAAGGGGAAVGDTSSSAGNNAGVINTGGGGAGGYAGSQKSGNGGSGIVIVRYQFQ